MIEVGSLVAGRYEVEREIGRGGFAVVYGARDRKVGTQVALKVMLPPPASAHLVRERTRRELVAVRALTHPHVVPIFDLVEEGPWLVLVMEWVKGGDLESVVAEKGPLSAEEVTALGRGVAEALSVAHRRGILHRDVKPRNVLVDQDGRARLSDFGSARVEGQETLTITGAMVGTMDYAAPEVLAGKRGDARADIFSLGVTLYLAVVGKLPPRPAVEAGHHPRQARPELPMWLDAIVARATAVDPRRRFPTAAAMAEALAARALAPLPEPRAVAGLLDFCLDCGAPEPLGRILCSRCGELPAAPGDTWLVVERPGSPGVAARLAALLSLPPDDPGARDAAAGRRVLARLPARLAATAARHLGERNVPVRTISRRADLGMLPRSLYLLTAVVGAAGVGASMLAAPVLSCVTPFVAGAVLFLGYRGVSRPLLVPIRAAEVLPPALARQVADALAALPEGEGRALLADVIRLARGVLRAAPTAMRVDDQARELVAVSCQAGGALGRVEEALVALAARRPQLGRIPESWVAESARLEAARAALIQHLLDATAALGEAYARAAQPDAELLEKLGRTSKEIHDELAIRAEARAEVDAITA